ncbi:MAG: L-histidine N(alpha)-methyltransferase [Candidatus Dadabacteria bacterium]|nr:L-histidine N(alpha)-methyltransferase [Candidatus Dadabacteria bacterium]NIS09543.1 L-histidine N(alpha)-methyltransferase [Candidatus Dadabacteria bacterium]NIV42755.1 L-histidine N(alpha)-methyltransferase [Candidatus Dadabacteria bacterium]NIX16649.1 L-histidine N(alpha)-methyltransferase [Candidatus Dadabacteria bacterium]NIY23190.1 L-histidine N(alpha)-methyltransferase [Candidatus Dadabacteria bacterium]
MNESVLKLNTHDPRDDHLLEEILSGLNQEQKELPCKLFYDKKGSELFDKITALPEYYPTRTEIEIIESNIEEISACIGKNSLLVELGSGSSIKIRLLLGGLKEISAYVPLDISYSHLIESTNALSKDFKQIKIIPLCVDYTKPFTFPDFDFEWGKIVVFYPGSTIGNFHPAYARKFLGNVAKRTGKGSGLLIGADLKKDKSVIENAYNDSRGVTAEFNLNILYRLNSEIGFNFDTDKWEHSAVYNEKEGRIEMHLVSLTAQNVSHNGTRIFFEKDESIITEYSYKYSLDEFEDLIKDYYRVQKVWVDSNRRFSLQYLSVI